MTRTDSLGHCPSPTRTQSQTVRVWNLNRQARVIGTQYVPVRSGTSTSRYRAITGIYSTVPLAPCTALSEYVLLITPRRHGTQAEYILFKFLSIMMYYDFSPVLVRTWYVLSTEFEVRTWPGYVLSDCAQNA